MLKYSHKTLCEEQITQQKLTVATPKTAIKRIYKTMPLTTLHTETLEECVRSRLLNSQINK